MNYQELADLHSSKSSERLTDEWHYIKQTVIHAYSTACEDYRKNGCQKPYIRFVHPRTFDNSEDMYFYSIRTVLFEEYGIPNQSVSSIYVQNNDVVGGSQRVVSIRIPTKN